MRLKTKERRAGAKYGAESIDPMDPMMYLNGAMARFPDRFELNTDARQACAEAPTLAKRARIVARREGSGQPLHHILVTYTPRPPAAPYRPKPFNVPKVVQIRIVGAEQNDRKTE